MRVCDNVGYCMVMDGTHLPSRTATRPLYTTEGICNYTGHSDLRQEDSITAMPNLYNQTRHQPDRSLALTVGAKSALAALREDGPARYIILPTCRVSQQGETHTWSRHYGWDSGVYK